MESNPERDITLIESEASSLRQIAQSIFNKANKLEEDLHKINEKAERDFGKDHNSPDKIFRLLEETKVASRKSVKELDKIQSDE